MVSEEDISRFLYVFKRFAKCEDIKIINKTVVEMTNFNLGVDEDDIEELLELVPEELTNEERSQLEHESIAE